MRRFSRLIKFAVSAGLIGVLLWKYAISWSSVAHTFRSINIFMLILLLPLVFNQYVISSIKWKLILASHGIRIPLPRLVQSYMIGAFFSAFLPSSFMGDFVRIADVSKATGKTFESASAVVLERLSGLAALTTVGGIASFAISYAFDEPLFRGLGFLFLALALTLVVIFVPGVIELTASLIRLVPLRPARRILDKIAGVVRHYRGRPALLIGVLLLSFLFQLMAYTVLFLYGRLLGIPLPYVYCLAFVPVVYLLEALPISVAGIGLREGGLVFFLSKVGYGASEAISLSILILSMRYLLNLSGGVLFALRGRTLPGGVSVGPSGEGQTL